MPLTMIKPKGRPATQCAHCREARKNKQSHVKCKCGTGLSSNGKHSATCPCTLDKELCTCSKNKNKSNNNKNTQICSSSSNKAKKSSLDSVSTKKSMASITKSKKHAKSNSSASISSITSSSSNANTTSTPPLPIPLIPSTTSISSLLDATSLSPSLTNTGGALSGIFSSSPSMPPYMSSPTMTGSSPSSSSILKSVSSCASLASLNNSGSTNNTNGSRRARKTLAASRGPIIHPASSASLSAKINALNHLDPTPSPPDDGLDAVSFYSDNSSSINSNTNNNNISLNMNNNNSNNNINKNDNSDQVTMFFNLINSEPTSKPNGDLLNSLDSIPFNNNLPTNAANDGSNYYENMNKISSNTLIPSSSSSSLAQEYSFQSNNTSSQLGGNYSNSPFSSSFMTEARYDGYVSDADPPLQFNVAHKYRLPQSDRKPNNQSNNNNNNSKLDNEILEPLRNKTLANSFTGSISTSNNSNNNNNSHIGEVIVRPGVMDDFTLLSPDDNYEVLKNSATSKGLLDLVDENSPNSFNGSSSVSSSDAGSLFDYTSKGNNNNNNYNTNEFEKQTSFYNNDSNFMMIPPNTAESSVPLYPILTANRPQKKETDLTLVLKTNGGDSENFNYNNNNNKNDGSLFLSSNIPYSSSSSSSSPSSNNNNNNNNQIFNNNNNGDAFSSNSTATSTSLSTTPQTPEQFDLVRTQNQIFNNFADNNNNNNGNNSLSNNGAAPDDFFPLNLDISDLTSAPLEQFQQQIRKQNLNSIKPKMTADDTIDFDLAADEGNDMNFLNNNTNNNNAMILNGFTNDNNDNNGLYDLVTFKD